MNCRRDRSRLREGGTARERAAAGPPHRAPGFRRGSRSSLLPGTGRGTATRSGVVEGAHGRSAGEVGPLHQASSGPPPRSGEELSGRRIVVTAGPTHEPIDPVRVIANRSSGKQGFAIAEALAAL